MVRTFLKVYMELVSYFLFLQEQIKDIIIITSRVECWIPETSLSILQTPELSTLQRDIHNAGFDGLQVKAGHCVCLDVTCPCSGLPAPAAIPLQMERHRDGCILRCSHEDYKAATKTQYRLRHSTGPNRSWTATVDLDVLQLQRITHRILRTGYLSVDEMETMAKALAKIGGAGGGGGGPRARPAAGRVARRGVPAPALAPFPVPGRSSLWTASCCWGVWLVLVLGGGACRGVGGGLQSGPAPAAARPADTERL